MENLLMAIGLFYSGLLLIFVMLPDIPSIFTGLRDILFMPCDWIMEELHA